MRYEFNQDSISFKLSHLLYQLVARITQREEKTKVITSSYLVKIIGTYLETIKDGGIVFGHFSRFLVILIRLPF